MILAGDIGGTNTRLAVFDDAGGRLRAVVERSYLNAGRGGLEGVLAAFADEVGGAADAERIDAACFGVAGPVAGRSVALTNLPWTIDADAVAAHLDVPPARVTLVNDMVAHGASTADLSGAEVDAVQPGRPDPAGARAILMPGTGLGVGGMAYDAAAGHVRPFPSEGGHVDFAPHDAAEERLWRSMRLVHARAGTTDRSVSWEDVLSGPGLGRVYACLASPESPDVSAAPAPREVVARADARSDPVAVETVDRFVRLLGSAAGNLALGVLATGGVYLGGSIVTGLAARLRDPSGGFLGAFGRVGPPAMRAVLSRVPVVRIDAPDTGLRGAARLAAWTRDET